MTASCVVSSSSPGAKEGGQLRADFVPDDLALLLMANSGVTAEATPAASRLLVAYLLDAFRADPAEPLPPPVSSNLSELFQPVTDSAQLVRSRNRPVCWPFPEPLWERRSSRGVW